MGAFWLKMIGSSGEPCPEPYVKKYADFSRRPRHIHPGDYLIFYAVGGRRRVFALAEVTSEVYHSGEYARWPYRVDISYEVNLPASAGVHVNEVSTPGRDLLRSINQNSYIRLSREEYERAAAKLREASRAGSR